MTAYRTGGNYGVPVSDADRLSYDPSKYVILVNDGYGDDPSGQNNNMATTSGRGGRHRCDQRRGERPKSGEDHLERSTGASGVQLTVSGAGRGLRGQRPLRGLATSSPRPVIGAAPTSPAFPAAT